MKIKSFIYLLEDVRDKVFWQYNHPKEADNMKRKILDKVLSSYSISHFVEQHKRMFFYLCELKRVKCKPFYTETFVRNVGERRTA